MTTPWTMITPWPIITFKLLVSIAFVLDWMWMKLSPHKKIGKIQYFADLNFVTYTNNMNSK